MTYRQRTKLPGSGHKLKRKKRNASLELGFDNETPKSKKLIAMADKILAAADKVQEQQCKRGRGRN